MYKNLIIMNITKFYITNIYLIIIRTYLSKYEIIIIIRLMIIIKFVLHVISK